MNQNYYQNPTFPNNQTQTIPNNIIPIDEPINPLPETQISYIENILRDNRGKVVKAYVSFPDSDTWKDKEFIGKIEEASIDHLIISDNVTGNWYLIKMLYLDYMEFMEPITYKRPI